MLLVLVWFIKKIKKNYTTTCKLIFSNIFVGIVLSSNLFEFYIFIYLFIYFRIKIIYPDEDAEKAILVIQCLNLDTLS